MLTYEQLLREAAAAGFQAEPMEKAFRLLEMLEALRSHPYLKDRLALKGGTALNLFVFKLPRLSVDIDMNYIGEKDRDTMLIEKAKVEQAVRAVCGRLGLQVNRVPVEHAGGKWRLSYLGISGRPGTLELDLNYLLRTPLWPTVPTDSNAIGAFSATRVPLLDLHELAAGKLIALFDRQASRDLFDVRSLLRDSRLDPKRLRLGFVVLGGTSRRDWRRVSIKDIKVDAVEVERKLIPMLRADLAPDRSEVISWSECMARECRELLSGLLPLKKNEVDFLTHLNEQGNISPELLTQDSEMTAIIQFHPGLLWKAQNVREYSGRQTF